MAATALIKAAEASKSSPSSVIKTGSPSKIQLTQSSVITNIQPTGPMQSIPGRSVTAITSSAIYTGSEGKF